MAVPAVSSLPGNHFSTLTDGHLAAAVDDLRIRQLTGMAGSALIPGSAGEASTSAVIRAPALPAAGTVVQYSGVPRPFMPWPKLPPPPVLPGFLLPPPAAIRTSSA